MYLGKKKVDDKMKKKLKTKNKKRQGRRPLAFKNNVVLKLFSTFIIFLNCPFTNEWAMSNDQPSMSDFLGRFFKLFLWLLKASIIAKNEKQMGRCTVVFKGGFDLLLSYLQRNFNRLSSVFLYVFCSCHWSSHAHWARNC